MNMGSGEGLGDVEGRARAMGHGYGQEAGWGMAGRAGRSGAQHIAHWHIGGRSTRKDHRGLGV